MKKFIYLLCMIGLFLLPNVVNATTIWEKTYVDEEENSFKDICKAKDGGYVAVGDKNIGFIVKYNADGTIAWQDEYGTDGTLFWSITAVEDGYIVGGSIDDGTFEGLDLKGASDALIVKYNLDGTVAWQVSFGGSENDRFDDVIAVEDGYIGIGMISSDDIVGMNTEGMFDATIVKFDLDGSIAWAHNYGGTETEEFFALSEVEDGYIVVGYTQSEDIVGITNIGYMDALIVKYNLDGTVAWQKNYGGTRADMFHSIIVEEDGFVVAGSISPGVEGLEVQGQYDAVIIKYDFDGDIIWQKGYGSTTDESFQSLTKVSNGYIAAGNVSISNTNPTLLLGGDKDAIAVMYDLDGELVWERTFGSSDEDEFEAICADGDNFVTVGKYSKVEEIEEEYMMERMLFTSRSYIVLNSILDISNPQTFDSIINSIILGFISLIGIIGSIKYLNHKKTN